MRINTDTRRAISWHMIADHQWMTSKHIGDHRDRFIAAFRNVHPGQCPGAAQRAPPRQRCPLGGDSTRLPVPTITVNLK